MDKQDTGAMSPVKKDAPVMKAWENYKATDDFQNTRRWALHEAHVDGSLWAAFYAGYFACAVNEQTQQSALTADAGMERAAESLGDLLGKNQDVIQKYVEEYAYDDGESSYHDPNDTERLLIMDAIHGLISDDEFVKTFNAWQFAIRAASAQVNAEGRAGLATVPSNEGIAPAPSAPDAGQVVVPVDPQRYVWTRDGMMSVTGNGEYVSSIIFDALQQVLKAEIHKHEITKQLFDEELADGDKLCSSLCFERTEGGRLPVRKMVADIGDVAMRCKRAEAEASERDALLRAADAIRAEAAKPSTTDTKHR